MSLTAIRTRLVSNLGAIQGIQRVYVGMPPPSQPAPAGADLPAVILGRQHPFATLLPTDDEYDWHFELLFLFKTAGQGGDAEEWDSGIEPFFRRFRDCLNADYNFGQSNTATSFSNEIDVDYIQVKGELYWGFRMQVDVSEIVTDTTYTVT